MFASDLDIGQLAVIEKVAESKLQNKLIEMGCFEGNTITKIFNSPLGDPSAFDINGYVLGLRKEEASLIHVILKK